MSQNEEDATGKVTDFFWKRDEVRIEVLDGPIQEGDTLHVTGEHTDEVIDVEDMEVDDEPVDQAEDGEIFAMPLTMRNRVMLGDLVFPHDDNAD